MAEHAERWEHAYQTGRTGWDLGQPAPPFVDLLHGPEAPVPGQLLAPGCGRGHDALLFARHGFAVTGVDIAPSAVAAASEAARQAGLAARFVVDDLFALAERWPAAFDYAVEHTCFCAIDPARRAEYARVLHAVLRPGGELIGLFLVHGRPGGPPYTTDEPEVRALMAPFFEIERLEPAANSHPRHRGQELFARLRRRATR